MTPAHSVNPLSSTSMRVVGFIARFADEHGYAPSVREIAEACDMSSLSVVAYHLNLLEERGIITREANTARTVRVVSKGGK